MSNLATFILSVLMAYTVYAQSPYLSSPYYYYNHQVLPTQPDASITQQNADQYVLRRDAVVSVLLRELKENSKRWTETNLVIENVKKEMTREILNLKNEVIQLKKSAEEKVDETKTQTEIITTEFEPFTFNSSKDGEIPTARFCSCSMVHAIIGHMSKDMAATDVKFTGITSTISKDLDQTNADLKDITNNIKTNLDATNSGLRAITDKLIADLADTNSNLNSLIALFQESMKPTTIDKEPSSCADLEDLGYKNSGIFSIKLNNQVLNVYCDFTKSEMPTEFEKLIGIVDVKTIRVSFHAQLNAPYVTASSTVPFATIVTNEGNAMSTTTGIFTAPVAGTYYFAFVGLSVSKKEARVELQKKTGAGSFVSVARAFGSNFDKETFAMDATLVLGKDDQIRLYLFQGEIHDSDTHNTNFIGFLLEEELPQVSSGN